MNLGLSVDPSTESPIDPVGWPKVQSIRSVGRILPQRIISDRYYDSYSIENFKKYGTRLRPIRPLKSPRAASIRCTGTDYPTVILARGKF
jgi:hypothetical protein